jgi:threonine aldolase
MAKSKVASEIHVYEIDNQEVGTLPGSPTIRVLPHWNRESMVELEVDGKRYTVAADALAKAIQDATNVP